MAGMVCGRVANAPERGMKNAKLCSKSLTWLWPTKNLKTILAICWLL